jgi:hypothetical protein
MLYPVCILAHAVSCVYPGSCCILCVSWLMLYPVCSILLDHEEAPLVREQAAVLLTNVSSHSVPPSAGGSVFGLCHPAVNAEQVRRVCARIPPFTLSLCSERENEMSQGAELHKCNVSFPSFANLHSAQ